MSSENAGPSQPTLRASGEEEPDELDTPFVPPGTHVGRYVVLDRVGVGGMGVVYAAYDPELDRKIALKLLRENPDSESAERRRARLLREAQALARLSHPNVIAVHDFGTFAGRVFIGMEFVAGLTLSSWLRVGTRSWAEVLEVLTAAGHGLAAAHAVGLVHRDFKPDNVLVGEDRRVRVTDFGLAAVRERTDGGHGDDASSEHTPDPAHQFDIPSSTPSDLTKLTRTRAVVGTPAYMAPEVFAGRSADERSDQFSFCVALYEALYGERPFVGNTFAELAANVTSGSIRVASSEPTIPRWIRRAMSRGLASDPGERHDSMSALLVALSGDERRRLRWRGWWLVPPAAVAAGLAAYPREPAQAGFCADSESKLEGIWDPARKRAARRAFLATEARFADHVWETVASELDAFRESWIGLQQTTCEASVAGQEALDVVALRMLCLHRRLQELDAVAAMFAEADVGIVEHAVDAVGTLGDLEQCQNPRLLMRHVGPRSDPTQSGELERIEGLLTVARAHRDAARYEDAVGLAHEASDAARALDAGHVVAEANHLLGTVHKARDQIDEAERSFHTSFSAALAAAHAEMIAQASLSLAGLTAARGGRIDEAKRWCAHAEAAIERLGGDPKLDAMLESAWGKIAQHDGDYQRAADRFERALHKRLQTVAEDDPRLVSYLSNSAATQADLGHYEDAVASLRRALAIEENALGPEHPSVGRTLYHLCGTLSGQGALDEAVPTCRRAVAVLERSVGPNHSTVATARLNLGGVLSRLRQHDEAVANLEAARAVFERTRGPNDPNVGRALNNLGVAYEVRAEFERAEHYERLAAEVFERAYGDSHPIVGISLANLGVVHTKLGNFDEALRELERATQILERELGPEHPDVAVSLSGIAQVWLGRDRPRRAIPYLERVLALREHSGYEPAELADTHWALAAALGGTGPKRARAISLARAARAAYRELGSARATRLADVEAWLAKHDA